MNSPTHNLVKSAALCIALISVQVGTTACGGSIYGTSWFGQAVFGADLIGGGNFRAGISGGTIDAMAVDNSGVVYVASHWLGFGGGVPMISKNTYTGSQVWLTGISSSDLKFDRSGNLFSNAGGTITKIAPDGITSPYVTLPGATAIAFDQNNNLYSASGNVISKTSSGGITSLFATLNDSTLEHGLGVDSLGNIFAETSSGLEKVDQLGNHTLLFTWADAPLPSGFFGFSKSPSGGLCLDENDNIYFTCNFNTTHNPLELVKYNQAVGFTLANSVGFDPSTALAYSPFDAVPSLLVPEPSVFSIITLAVSALLFRRKLD